MKRFFMIVGSALVLVPHLALAADEPSDSDVVVAAVKADNPNLRVLCQTGREGISKAVTAKVVELAAAGKLKGDPQAVGGEAGQKIGKECRGG